MGGGDDFGADEEKNRKRRKVAADLGLLPLSFAPPKVEKKKTCGMNPSSGGLPSELSQCTRKQPNFPRSRNSDNAAKSL